MGTLVDQLEQNITRSVIETRAAWSRQLQATSPVDTGELRSATTVDMSATPTTITLEAAADTPYAQFVASGTRPHVIRPRNSGGVLRFTVAGRVVFATEVNHPGTRPNMWWEDAWRSAADTLRRVWPR